MIPKFVSKSQSAPVVTTLTGRTKGRKNADRTGKPQSFQPNDQQREKKTDGRIGHDREDDKIKGVPERRPEIRVTN